MKRVLVLGSGLVARPLIRYLLDKAYEVVVGSLEVNRAAGMIEGHPNGKALRVDVADEASLSGLIRECDLAVSLLPYLFHPTVARLCIANRKPMVTTSYVSAQMQELDCDARKADVTILNEIGLDPGIDHMSAMKAIDDIRKRGGKVIAFRSYCGGLPAPEANDNPFGYKFSWAPRGVLLAGRNDARYILDGCKVEIPSHRVFRDVHVLAVEGQGDYEAYPNRDSIGYIDVYGLQGIQTIFRGTLRNMGWCDCLFNFARLGLLALDEIDVREKTYADFMRSLSGCAAGDDPAAATARKLGIPRASLPIMNLAWLGMFSDRKFAVEKTTPLDALGDLMFEKLAFAPGERDMVVMHHNFRAEFPGGRHEQIISELIDYGIPGGDSTMSRTVSLPAAIGADLILSGRLETKGVLRPVLHEIYSPVLDELATLGISCKERTNFY